MRFLFLTLFILSSKIFLAQAEDDNRITFKVSCGWGGMTSSEIISVKELVKSNNYAILRLKLFGNDKMSAVLSMIAFRKLQDKKVLSLTTEEQNQINNIEDLEDNYLICYTCTQEFKGTIKRLLKNRSSPAYLLLLSSIFDKD